MGSTCSPRDYYNYNSIYIYNSSYNSIYNSNSLCACNSISHSTLRSEAQATHSSGVSMCFCLFVDMWLGLLLCNPPPPFYPARPVGPRTSGALNLSLGFVAQSRKLHNCPSTFKIFKRSNCRKKTIQLAVGHLRAKRQR